MPIFKELHNIPYFPLWKQSSLHTQSAKKDALSPTKLYLQSLPSESSDYIRKIGEHFISFIHKLDQSDLAKTLDPEIALYAKYCGVPSESISDFWIGHISSFLASTLSQKYLKIT